MRTATRAAFMLICAFVLSAPISGQTTTGKGTIWFYSQRVLGEDGWSRIIYDATASTRRLAELGKDEFFGLSVTPGVFYFSLERIPERSTSAKVTVVAGADLYVEVQSRT